MRRANASGIKSGVRPHSCLPRARGALHIRRSSSKAAGADGSAAAAAAAVEAATAAAGMAAEAQALQRQQSPLFKDILREPSAPSEQAGSEVEGGLRDAAHHPRHLYRERSGMQEETRPQSACRGRVAQQSRDAGDKGQLQSLAIAREATTSEGSHEEIPEESSTRRPSGCRAYSPAQGCSQAAFGLAGKNRPDARASRRPCCSGRRRHRLKGKSGQAPPDTALELTASPHRSASQETTPL